MGKSLSRKDDLISLFYVLIWFAKDGLPWEKLSLIRDEKQLNQRILEAKKNTPFSELANDLSSSYKKFGENVSRLSFEEKPDYE